MLQSKEVGAGVKDDGAEILHVVPLAAAASRCEICCRSRTMSHISGVDNQGFVALYPKSCQAGGEEADLQTKRKLSELGR
jgi:hypothetical protein